jgi:hypothetical protein
MAAISSLFRNEDSARGLADPRPSSPTIAIRPPTAPRPDTLDARLIGILDAPLELGETATSGFARKERELGAVFATLTVLEARVMQARLATVRTDDELANKFARLTCERRGRLISFLADARRREAMTVGRR